MTLVGREVTKGSVRVRTLVWQRDPTEKVGEGTAAEIAELMRLLEGNR